MSQCIAARKRGTLDPCPSRALYGHPFCGVHARMKSPLIWTDAMRPHCSRIERVQALVRGWLVRRRLKLAGPGVLSRRNLANDEDIISYLGKDRVSPFEYFAFEENGRIWWFHFHSLWRWMAKSPNPYNPYTKVPLSVDTRKRLREIWGYSLRHRHTLPPEADTFEDRFTGRWNVLCQSFADHGFENITPGMFHRLTKSDYASVFVLLGRDIETVFPASDPVRDKAMRLCKRAQLVTSTDTYYLQCVFTMLWLLTLHRDPYVMTFTLLSALYRC